VCEINSFIQIAEYKETTKRTKRCKRFFDESNTPDTKLTASDQFRVVSSHYAQIVSLWNFTRE